MNGRESSSLGSIPSSLTLFTNPAAKSLTLDQGKNFSSARNTTGLRDERKEAAPETIGNKSNSAEFLQVEKLHCNNCNSFDKLPTITDGVAISADSTSKNSDLDAFQAPLIASNRQRKTSALKGETEATRRLSQLFIPPNEEDLEKELSTYQNNEASRLLSQPPNSSFDGLRKISKHKKGSAGHKKAFSIENIIGEKSKSESTGLLDGSDFNSSSSSSSASDSNSDADQDEALSWNDTICSQRSAWFKHYYGEENKSKVSTRASSLTSLIREKNYNKFSTSPVSNKEKAAKKRENHSLMILVIFLFLVLVIGISLIHHFYYLHLLELSLFKRVKFHEDNRLLDVYDVNGEINVLASIGEHLPPYGLPGDCTHYMNYLNRKDGSTPHDHTSSSIPVNITESFFIHKRRRKSDLFYFDKDTVCLDWVNQARIQIHNAPSRGPVNCYQVFWSVNSVSTTLKDCIHIKHPENGVWWGIGEIIGGGYPLGSISVNESPYITGQLSQDTWGKLIKRALISSKGGLVLLPDHIPLSLSIDKERLCLMINSSKTNTNDVIPSLNYTICSSPNVSSTVSYLHYLAHGPDSLDNLPNSNGKASKTEHYKGIWERIQNPVWVPYFQPENFTMDQNGTLGHIESIMEVNNGRWGHIILSLDWQRKSGDLSFDSERFPNPKDMIDSIHRKGFKIILTISPIVSTESLSFQNCTSESILVQQIGSSMPVLLHYKSTSAGALLDFTNKKAVNWFANKLEKFVKQYEIDGFHLSYPDAHSIPFFHEFREPLSNPDVAITDFITTVTQISQPLSIDASITPPPFPTFVLLGSEESGWSSLASMIPRILTLTMVGFTLIDAGAIGGIPDRPGNHPDDELYVRWSQAAAFLPAYQINSLPSLYNKKVQSIVESVAELRKNIVIPKFKDAIYNVLTNSTPLIFPLGYLYPDDPVAGTINDEWIIGDDVLVAPVLHKGATSRRIYLPYGLWESQIDKTYQRGPGWYEHKVPLTDIAYFILRYRF